MALSFPFSAIVGQDEMKLAILIAAIDPTMGGVLVFGDRGTGKSTAVRALAALLPKMRAVLDCAYGCDPAALGVLCEDCARRRGPSAAALRSHLVPVPVVDLPLGATEDRVVGALDLERALSQGIKAFEPGLLARANRGFLYIDEVNLLEDHLVDLLIDVAASGENVVEREGLSVRHPARFVLVGSGNPEEGELRPQLLDRFGLSVEVKTPDGLAARVEVVRRRDAFERDPVVFIDQWRKEDERTRRRIVAGRTRLNDVVIPDAAHGTEGTDADVMIRIGFTAVVDFHQDAGRVLQVEHGIAEHFPIGIARVWVVGVFHAQGPALVQRVFDLSGDLLIGQIGKKRKLPLRHAATEIGHHDFFS